MPASKTIPRFVPTLTEVVQPGPFVDLRSIDAEWLAEQVLQTVKPKLEQQLRASLQVLIEQQMRATAPSLHREMEEAIRVAVALALERIGNTKNSSAAFST